ncbi:hypothetical protein [Arenibaculum pallidiluteum]|uniref:hypothetical protein n=1 Tax=Arenibaculum pallidiluteum TaxID=2812559 RepID=UPI001A966610|nr:hypothetical protein [Arenibaculum pallidiluteum]
MRHIALLSAASWILLGAAAAQAQTAGQGAQSPTRPQGAAAAAPAEPAAPAADWRITQVAGQGGALAYCVAEARYSNGLALIVARTPRGEVNLAVGIPKAGLTKGTKFPLTVSLDGKIQRRLEGVANEQDLIVVPTGTDSELFDGMRRGNRLSIQGPQDTAVFQLKGTGKALGELRTCSERGAGGKPAGARSAGAQQGQPPGPPPIPDALRMLLVQAGIEQIQLLDLSRLPPEQRPADFAWRVGPVYSGVREIQAPPDATLDKLSEVYLGGLKERCPGPFVANPAATSTVAGIDIRTAEATCDQQGRQITVAMLFYLTKNRLFTVFFNEAGEAEKAQAVKIRDDIAGVVRRLAAAPPPAAEPAKPKG